MVREALGTLVQDYVAGRLADPARSAFEERISRDVELMRELEETLRLREGLEILRERGELARLAGAPSAGNATRRPRRRWAAAAAAAVVAVAIVAVAIVAVRMASHTARPSALLAASSPADFVARSGAPIAGLRQYTFAASREAERSPHLALPASGALELRVLTPMGGVSPTFRVTLAQIRAGEGAAQLGVAEHLVPDADGFVAVYADAARLQPGDYVLSVESEGVGAAHGAGRFTFNLTRGGPADSVP